LLEVAAGGDPAQVEAFLVQLGTGAGSGIGTGLGW